MPIGISSSADIAAQSRFAMARQQARQAEEKAERLRSEADAAQRNADQEQKHADQLTQRSGEAAQHADQARRTEGRTRSEVNQAGQQTLPQLPQMQMPPRNGFQSTPSGYTSGQYLSVMA